MRGWQQRAVALVVAMALTLTPGMTAVSAATRAAGRAVSVVVMKAWADDTGAERAVARVGGQVGQRLPIVNGFAATVPESALGELTRVPGVVSVTPNGRVRVSGQYGEGSGVASAVYTEVTKAQKTWNAGYTGQGVNVALIDTGVDTTGDLAGQVIHAVDFTPEATTADANKDTYGHGTFVAGVIAGTGQASAGAVKGVAPNSKIVSIKIAGRDGSTDVLRLLAALQYIVTYKDALGIRVLNLSLGTSSKQSYLIDPLNFAVERVWNAGIVVVAAAGNNGNAPGTVTKPGDDPFIITVGASDDRTTVNRDDDKVASFSGAGSIFDIYGKPDVVAPGAHIVSSRAPGSTIELAYPNSKIDANYFKGSGTSFSSAAVAGQAALIISRNWNLSPDQVKKRIRSTANPLSSGSVFQQGQGQVNAFQATMSDDTTAANLFKIPAFGGGSLQNTRGSGALYQPDGRIMTDAEADAATGFDSARYFGSQWAGSQWTGSQWTGSQWTGSQWTGSQWAGSQWAGSQWTGSQWAGSQWAGSQWTGSQWTGSQWTGSQWTGSQWAGSQWSGLEWSGSHWS
jgi:serine protease AprX